jgi:CDP-diacylglycerol--glycerol-3-phosphate 3-phosphatidyltransferase
MSKLRRLWGGVAVLGLLALLLGWFGLSRAWQPWMAWRWFGLATVIGGYVLGLLWYGLAHNYRDGEGLLLDHLGAGNTLSLLRGLLLAALAGFLVLPRPPGWLGWLPGLLYISAALIDLFDGYAARRMGQVTLLGADLDMGLDGLGMLLASGLAVQYGQTAGWFLLVGLARYLYVAGLWLRQRRGLPIHALPSSNTRRPFAGAMMGFVGMVLLPVFTPPVTQLAAVAFALPLLAGFLRDWLVVSGAVKSLDGSVPGLLARRAGRWLPVALRLLVVGLIIAWLSGSAHHLFAPGAGAPVFFARTAVVLGCIGMFLLALGAAGRLAALSVLVAAGLRLSQAGFTPLLLMVFLVSIALFYLGTGALSLWTPEDRLIYRRLGER